MICFTPFRQLTVKSHRPRQRTIQNITAKSYPVSEIPKIEIKSEECAQEISSCFIFFTQQMKVIINCGKSDILKSKQVVSLAKNLLLQHPHAVCNCLLFNIELFEFSSANLEKGLLAQFLFIREIIISALKKIALFPLFPRYLTLYHLFPEHIVLRYQKTKRSCSIPFAQLREKQEYQVSNIRVKSKKIATFASQRIIEFKQFLTRPNLACSVAKTDRRFFSVLMFHETISN